MSLLAGARLVCVSDDVKIRPSTLGEILVQEKVSIMQVKKLLAQITILNMFFICGMLYIK
jgi:hypothetical protein